jgi:hypothetical protein
MFAVAHGEWHEQSRIADETAPAGRSETEQRYPMKTPSYGK